MPGPFSGRDCRYHHHYYNYYYAICRHRRRRSRTLLGWKFFISLNSQFSHSLARPRGAPVRPARARFIQLENQSSARRACRL